MDDRNVTIMSRNTRHNVVYTYPEYPLMGSCIIFYKHKVVSSVFISMAAVNTLRRLYGVLES